MRVLVLGWFRPEIDRRCLAYRAPRLVAGGVVIKSGDEVIGAIGVGGAPGGDKDEVCAQAAVAKIANRLQ